MQQRGSWCLAFLKEKVTESDGNSRPVSFKSIYSKFRTGREEGESGTRIGLCHEGTAQFSLIQIHTDCMQKQTKYFPKHKKTKKQGKSHELFQLPGQAHATGALQDTCQRHALKSWLDIPEMQIKSLHRANMLVTCYHSHLSIFHLL